MAESKNVENLVLTHAATGHETKNIIDQITRPDITSETVQYLYTQWADTYDQDLSKLEHGYNGPAIGAKELAGWLGERKDARILDCGAGTGLCGLELSKLGFSDIDAVDASTVMLEKAEQKGVYKNTICDYLGTNHLKIPDETYDGLLAVGIFCCGHVTWDCFPELIRVTKTGGYITLGMTVHRHPPVVTVADAPEPVSELEAEILRLQKEGKWTMVRRKLFQNYHDQYTGVVYGMRKVTEGQFKVMLASGKMDAQHCTIQRGEA